jgi:hypothetical protein
MRFHGASEYEFGKKRAGLETTKPALCMGSDDQLQTSWRLETTPTWGMKTWRRT